MGKQFTLTANDSHQLGAYRADPSGPSKGGVVVIQEIFGVNKHIRAVCDRLASEGYTAVAPALFDRTQKGFECGYTPDEISDMGENFLARFMHPDDFASLAKLGAEYATRKDGEVFEHVFRMRHKNGQWRWVQRMATIFSRTPD